MPQIEVVSKQSAVKHDYFNYYKSKPTIELCDEVVYLEDGKVKAQGSHDELLENVNSYKSLFLESQKSK